MTEQEPAQPSNGGRRVAAGAGFFGGAGRRTCLEQLRHLSQWSRRVLLVTGPRGAGKTMLYRQFSATLEPRAKAARIDAGAMRGPRDVLYAAVQGFGIAAPADADGRLLGELVAVHAHDQEGSDRYCVVLVDDAEQLEARTVEVLIGLAASSPLRVVLFGEVRLVAAVERAAAGSDASWHEIRLGPFDPDEVRDYLQWWFQSQGRPAAVALSDAQVAEIARVSEGLPGRIDQMARVLLAKLESQDDELPSPERFPTLHRALLAVLVVAVGLVYLIWQPTDQEADRGSVRIETVEVPPPEVARRSDDPGRAPARQEPPDAVQQVPPRPATPPEAAPPSAPAPAASEPSEPSNPAPVRTEPPPAAERPPSAEPPPTAEPPAPARPDEPTDPAAEAGGARNAAWIMARSDARHTLQLASFSSAERAAAYLADQDEPEAFAVFRQQRDGRILHVVIYGDFATRAEAQRAAGDLPSSLGNVQPWIRSFGDVQAAVRTALQR